MSGLLSLREIFNHRILNEYNKRKCTISKQKCDRINLHGEIFISNKGLSLYLYRVRDVTHKRNFLHRILSDSRISFLDKEFSA